MKKRIKKWGKKAKQKHAEATAPPQPGKMPNITNTTVAEHRDEVLSSARKFIYPLQHSKHKIVLISTAIFIATLIAFFTYCTLALYKMQSTSGFLYRITQVVPFPIARIGSQLVAYENYLFELRRYVHYYETQQKLDFENNELDKTQLDEFKKRALQRVIDFAYIKRIADEQGITVSDQEVQDEIKLLREQNRLGTGDETFEDVLKDYFGWSRSDFERYLHQELMIQKVAAALDTEAQERANQALAELQGGADFADVAKKYSDDVTTKENGGAFGFTIDQNSRDLTAEATATLFALESGQFSEIINTGYSLEIFNLLDKKNGKVEAAHIQFNFKDINTHINDLKEAQPARVYITQE